MTVLFCSNTGKKITLTNQIASSGEGTVWNTDWSEYLAKVYHSPNNERVNKLKVMVTHRPKEPNSHLNHISFAWPKSLLKDSNGWVLGFLMPAIIEGRELIDVYNPQRRKQLRLGIDWNFLHTTAMNIASIIQSLHVEGCVLGDIKPQNILVNNRALPSIIDTDSFQVRHPKTGEFYLCLVGSEEFTPVELLGKDFHITQQSEVHDRFRLAVIIYHLLFGNHPFQGRWTGAGDSPDTNQLIHQGFWPYAPNSLIKPGPLTIPLDIVHPEIQQCFKRCFNDGHTRPDLRPTAGEWVKALKVAITDLTPCHQITTHYYSRNNGSCYWCERAKNLGVDIFPGAVMPQSERTVTVPTSESKVFASDNVPELIKHKGQKITVEGKVVSINDHAQYNKFILNFGKLLTPGSFGYFRIVILSPNVQNITKVIGIQLNSLNDLIGITIRITGIIEISQVKKRSYPQVILEDPKLKVLNNNQDNKLPVQSPNKRSTKIKTTKLAKNPKRNELAKPTKSVNTNSINYFKQGRIYARKGNYQAAIKAYNKSLQHDPKYASAYNNRGVARYMLGDKKGAIKDLEKAVQLGSKNASNNLIKLK